MTKSGFSPYASRAISDHVTLTVSLESFYSAFDKLDAEDASAELDLLTNKDNVKTRLRIKALAAELADILLNALDA